MDFQAMLPIFSGVFLAELGDKTQLATLCFTMRGGLGRLEVFLAAGAALVLATGLGVAAGQAVGLLAEPEFLKAGAGVVFIILGLAFLREGLRERRPGPGSAPPCA
ncbi:MAG: TMEM165/GDT1 family protein [Candidatus Adiutrix sp.]|jgi:putative Ca2+/H+ antiporter (TMEM165/GDT1 family)|nr:TMEM165/GDT1 family protein [Candidatus Adiutrix sp.]